MKLLQQLATTFLPPGLIEDIKQETNEWQMRCTSCGKTKPLWEAGGIRYKKATAGNANATLVRCSLCRGIRTAVVERTHNAPPVDETAESQR